jgi:N-acetylmuramoyl-L-alanine amidase
MGARAHVLAFRIGVVVSSVAALLVPGWAAPARTISVPATLARSVELSDAGPGPHSLTFSFAPTHVAFEWSAEDHDELQFRTVDEDGSFSAWRTAHADADASTSDAHFSSAIAVDRPRSLQWRADGGITDVSIDYVNTLDGPRRSVSVPALADAAPRAPDIVTRAEWGADESVKRTTGTCTRVFYRVQQLFVHHTAGVNDDPHPKATMRAIYHFHTQQRGWCDVGYNFVIAPDGTTFEGRWARKYAPWEIHSSENVRGEAVSGAHVAEFNSGSVGVSMMGNFSQMPPSPAARRALAELLAWEADRHDLRPKGTHTYKNPSTSVSKRLPYIAGHRDAGQTECPGNHLYSALSAVRRDVKAVIGPGKADTALSLEPSSKKATYGEEITLSGTLTQGAAGLGGQTVVIYSRSRGPWSTEATVETAPDGSFSHSFAPKVETTVRAVYDGNAESWGSQSRDVKVLVGPAVDLEARGGLLDAGGVTHYPPGTTQVELGGTVVPAHPGETVVVHVGEVGPDGTPAPVAREPIRLDDSGTFTYLFEVPDPVAGGTFRATAWFKSDGDHASNASEPVTFVIDPSPATP